MSPEWFRAFSWGEGENFDVLKVNMWLLTDRTASMLAQNAKNLAQDVFN